MIMSSGFSIVDHDEPVQTVLREAMLKNDVAVIQYLFPERQENSPTQDLTIISGCRSLAATRNWVREQFGDIPELLWGISFGGNVSIEESIRDQPYGLIVLNAVFDYFSFRLSQVGRAQIDAWRQRGSIRIPYSQGPMTSYYRFIEEAVSQRLEHRVNTISCPVHAAQGAADSIISPSHIMQWSATNSCVESIVIEGADHVFADKHAIERYVRLVSAWINRILAT